MICKRCGEKNAWFDIDGGLCPQCRSYDVEQKAQQAAAAKIELKRLTDASSDMPITTGHNIPGAEILAVIDIVTAEAAMSMSIFKDIATSWRDTFGGRSTTLQNELREARRLCLQELRREALSIGANAVIGVDLDYSEFTTANVSGGMLFVVASGTAVKLG